jgi:hypothetical protein
MELKLWVMLKLQIYFFDIISWPSYLLRLCTYVFQILLYIRAKSQKTQMLEFFPQAFDSESVGVM